MMLNKKLLALFLSISITGCSTQGSYQFGPDPYEMGGLMLLMLPIAIVLSPITIPIALIKNSKEQSDKKEIPKEEIIINANVFRLTDDQYTFPTVYYENNGNRYKAFIPAYKNEVDTAQKIEKLKENYTKEFSTVINNIRYKNLQNSWIAYEYKKENWLVFDEKCNILGNSSTKEFRVLQPNEITQELWDVRNLCKQRT